MATGLRLGTTNQFLKVLLRCLQELADVFFEYFKTVDDCPGLCGKFHPHIFDLGVRSGKACQKRKCYEREFCLCIETT